MEKNTEEGLREHYEKYKEVIKRLTIMSDLFMRNVLKEIACTEYILQVITGNAELHVVEQMLQKDYANMHGRAARMDCLAMDEAKQIYNLEIQQEKQGASPKRLRYHASLIDVNILNSGSDFQKLPYVTVIFITRDDVMGMKQPVYHIERRITEMDQVFEDEVKLIYVNFFNRDDTELGRLMHDFHCADAKDMYSDILAARVHMLKETEEGIDIMCKEMEMIYNDGVQMGEARGIEIGALRQSRKSAVLLARKGTSIQDIADVLEVGTDMVSGWLNEASCK